MFEFLSSIDWGFVILCGPFIIIGGLLIILALSIIYSYISEKKRWKKMMEKSRVDSAFFSTHDAVTYRCFDKDGFLYWTKSGNINGSTRVQEMDYKFYVPKKGE